MYNNKVREAMGRAGISTQTQLAEKIGITKNQLSVILSEKYKQIENAVPVELASQLGSCLVQAVQK